MRNYVLVRDAHNLLCPKPYIDNVLLDECFQHYLVEKGNIYELVDKSPYGTNINHKIRCPKCMAQLVKITNNKYKCVICEGR